MTWVFAILLVLALGAIAVVASGRGEPMADPWEDRPAGATPAQGPLGAEDLRQVRFSLAFRGYRMSEVDALLERLAQQRETMPGTPPERPAAPGPATGDGPGEPREDGVDEGPEEPPGPSAGRGERDTG